MNIIPSEIFIAAQTDPQKLYNWFGEEEMKDIERKNHAHLLVKLHNRLELQGVYDQLQGYHHHQGPGCPIVHSVEKLLRALIVGGVNDLSLRELEQRIRYDLVVRWYVGYARFEETPDHVTLERFTLWMLSEHERLLFDEVLGQIEQDFPQERQRVQIGDTYALIANAAQESLVRRLRHATQYLQRACKRERLGDEQSGLSNYNWSALYGEPKEPIEALLDKDKRQQRQTATVLAVHDLLGRIEPALKAFPPSQYGGVRQWVERLRKMVSDDYRIEQSADGPLATKLKDSEKGDYRLGSATDPEATFRMHGTEEKDIALGYNVQVAATTTGFIRETQAYTGATPDKSGVANLVSEQQEHLGVCPPKLIYDTAGGSGKVRAEVEAASAGQTELVAKLPPCDKGSERYSPYDFTLSEDHHTLTCPNGKSSSIAYPSRSGDGDNFRFFAFQCWQGSPPAHMEGADLSMRCPFWEKCRDSRQGPRTMRHVFISDYRDQVLAAQKVNQTEGFTLDMKLRPRIERVIFELTHYNGARRCRRRGLLAADFQSKLSSTAYNLKLWMRKLDHPNSTRRAWCDPIVVPAEQQKTVI